jgi:sporulation protein YlmC with PRC-barrel domain
MDPVSWKVVERGWQVLGPAGKELGTVEDVVGDVDADIFHSLMVASGLLGRTTEVPSERVSEIREGEVVLDGDSL